MIGPARVAEQPVDRQTTALGRWISLEMANFIQRWYESDRVERRSAEEREIVAERGNFDAFDLQLGPDRAFTDLTLGDYNFGWLERSARGRHAFGACGANGDQQVALI